MPKDFFVGRQNPLPLKSLDELNQRLAALENCFGPEWLAEKADHPLKVLWQRSDTLAAIELLNFGNAVMKMDGIDSKWTKRQVEKIKYGSRGESDGAIFEVLALSLFPEGTCEVIPAPESQPGYDATLKLRDQSPVLVSLKNHGRSTYEEFFTSKASGLDRVFQESLIKLKHCRPVNQQTIPIAYFLLQYRIGNSGPKMQSESAFFRILSPIGPASMCRARPRARAVF